jgi:WD40 repeat protein
VLIGAALIALAWLSNLASIEEDIPVRIVEGEPEVQTTALAVSRAGTVIATTDTAGRVALRNAEGGWTIQRFLPCVGYAKTVAFSPDDRFLAAGFERGVIRFDMKRNGSAQAVPVPIDMVKSVAFSPDGQTLAATTERDGTIILWDLGKRRAAMLLREQSRRQEIAFSPDGRYLASGGFEDRSITIRDLDTASPKLRLALPRGPVAAIAFSPDGAYLAAVCGFGCQVRLWSLRSSGSCRWIAGHPFGTTSIAFAPGGATLATVGSDGMVVLWSVATGKPLARFHGRTPRLNAIAFFPDGGSLVAAGSNDNSIRVWELSEPEPGLPDGSPNLVLMRSPLHTR